MSRLRLPQLQNIPIRSELAKRLREAFRKEFERKGLLIPDTDYGALELRIVANMEKNMTETGCLRVWHIPQVPGAAFHVSVPDLATAKLVLHVLADYDAFQLANRIKPDYCNIQGLEQYDSVGKSWCEWEDEEGLDINEVMRRDEHPDAPPC